jgi:hypothetical protein
MKRRIWFSILAVIFLLVVFLGGGFLFHMAVRPPSRALAPSLTGDALTFSPSPVHSFDARPCVKMPSSQTCNGILPFFPHGFFERGDGAGACYDTQSQLMEAQEIKDAQNTIIGSMQLLYFPKCQTYSAHLLYQATHPQGNSIQAEVDQFNANPLSQALNSFATWSGFDAEEELSPDAVQSTGVVSDYDVWTPMVYSPTAPVQATAQVGHGDVFTDPKAQRLLTGYYAAGHATTVNGNQA